MPRESHLIDTRTLQSALSHARLRVLDCRFDLGDTAAGRRDYLDGHIPGAVFADLDRDLSGPVTARSGRHPLPGIDDLAATLGRLGIDESSRVVVYDSGNGAIAARAWWMLRWLGHDDVRVLDGGFAKWTGEHRPLSSGEERVTASEFRPGPRPGRVVSTREIAANLADMRSLRLIDARDAARFRGEVEPIDPVAGHIPGSINLPLTGSLNGDGTWRSNEELRGLWRGVLGSKPDVAWCVMCGSGVTACHLAISGMQAGYAEPRLYVGSWSEWIRDPARPIALGAG